MTQKLNLFTPTKDWWPRLALRAGTASNCSSDWDKWKQTHIIRGILCLDGSFPLRALAVSPSMENSTSDSPSFLSCHSADTESQTWHVTRWAEKGKQGLFVPSDGISVGLGRQKAFLCSGEGGTDQVEWTCNWDQMLLDWQQKEPPDTGPLCLLQRWLHHSSHTRVYSPSNTADISQVSILSLYGKKRFFSFHC